MKNLGIFALSRQAMISLVFLFVASQMAFAQPGDEPEPRRHHRMVEELNLDESQRQLWRSIRRDGRENIAAMVDLQEELHALVHSDQYSDAEVQSLARQIGEAMAANIEARAKTENAFYQSLTAEQKTQLKAMKSHRVHRIHIR